MVIAETDRLTLRHVRLADGEALARVFGDPEVMRYGPGVRTPQQVRRWLLRNLADYERRGFGRWAVVERHSDRVIGYCGLAHFRGIPGQPETEIGYRLARAHWGRGLATEAALAVRDHAFHTLRLPRLVALIDPGNVPSVRVAEKIGMRFESDVMMSGYDHPDRLYAIAGPSRAPSSSDPLRTAAGR